MIIVLLIFGLVFGSFLTAFVDRLHDGRDWINGRSECDSCHKELKAQDLVPVFSWLINFGRCRQCHKHISWRYPLTELAVAGLFTACYLLWPVPIVGFEIVKFVWLLITIVGLTAISIYDLRWMIIPNTIIYPLIVLAVGVVGYEAIFLDGGPELVRSAVLGLLGCGGILYGIFQVSKGKWIGGGDVKLGFLLGIMALSFMRGLLVILLSSFVGLVAIAPMLFAHKFSLKAKIPFGPFLIIAGLIVYFFGQQLLDWYMNVLVV